MIGPTNFEGLLMSTQTLSYLDAIEHLPAGGTLIFGDVSWDEYEQLLADLGDSNRVRVYYDAGRLEIMSPSSFHEMYKELTLRMACLVAEKLDLSIETRGSTTFKQEWAERGGEPDTCFYIQNAAAVIGKRKIDLAIDPPPDIVVEIDVSHESTRKLEFYAGLGVPELWRYDEERMRIYVLTEGSYNEVPASRTFPFLTSETLTRFFEQSKTEGQSEAFRSFRKWLDAQNI
jgi:Uma2 family endonuclease